MPESGGKSAQGEEEGNQEQGQEERDDPEQVPMQRAAGGEFIAADRAAVLVRRHVDRAAGAFTGWKLRLGIDLHRVELIRTDERRKEDVFRIVQYGRIFDSVHPIAFQAEKDSHTLKRGLHTRPVRSPVFRLDPCTESQMRSFNT